MASSGIRSVPSGLVTVDGAGSKWTINGDLSVDTGGTGTLTITRGGVVSNANGFIATLALDKRHSDCGWR